jgi:hypothetical protein
MEGQGGQAAGSRDNSAEREGELVRFLNRMQSAQELTEQVEFPGRLDARRRAAERILARRRALGGAFKSFEDVASVPQLGAQRLAALLEAVGRQRPAVDDVGGQAMDLGQRLETERLAELRESGEAIGRLADDTERFRRAVEAFRGRDVQGFQAALAEAGLLEHCRFICRWLCSKHNVFICMRLCGPIEERAFDVEEIREFAQATARIARDEALLRRLLDAIDKEDAQAFRALVAELKLERFCHQLCHWLCFVRCRYVCELMCPPVPLITRVGAIPISQIGPQGFGYGPSIPPFQVPPPNPAAGVGDHPFGASAELRGVFNMPSATQYLVEWAPNPAGPYTPIQVPVQGYNYISVSPYIAPVTRFPSTGADPGWYDVAAVPDSDGGPTALSEKRLMDWPTTMLPDGIYYLRLRVRDGGSTRTSSPQIVQTDNTAPPTPTIQLRLQRPDGTSVELKCGQVKKGEGLIAVTVQAFDKNFSRLSVAAQGNSSLSVPLVDTSAVPLSKTYNGNTADQGYPAPTTFMWDPWSDPRIVPCCYVVRIDIWDRAVLNNSWAGGHGNSGWEAIEIGF